MTYAEIAALAGAHHLDVFGGFHPLDNDGTPDGTGTVVLFAPREPGFWAHVSGEAEFQDNTPDPIDRWSTRAICDIAQRCGGAALFPFGGPPYQPFIKWAERTGRAWVSPVGMLVHEVAGLMISIRGAVALTARLDLPDVPDSPPCQECDQPCLTACPVGALGAEKLYDVPACHDHLATDAGQDCMTGGCLARRACPVSQSFGRLPAQSAHHMRHFHR